MPLPRDEQETVIRVGYYDETCTISTSNPAHARRLIKAGLTPSISRIPARWDEVEHDDGHKTRKPVEWDDATWSFEAPASWFKLPRPPKQMSEEARRAAGERLRRAREQDEDDE